MKDFLTRPAFFLLPACLLASLLPLSAQSFEVAATGGATRIGNAGLGTLLDSTGGSAQYSLTNGWRIGFRTTINAWRFFGYEFGYGYNRTHLREEVSQTESGMA